MTRQLRCAAGAGTSAGRPRLAKPTSAAAALAPIARSPSSPRIGEQQFREKGNDDVGRLGTAAAQQH